MIIFVLGTLAQDDVAERVSAGRKPRGLSGRNCGIRVKAVAWAGGTHEAGSETVSWPKLVWLAECEDVRVIRCLHWRGAMGGRKKPRTDKKGGGATEDEDVVVFSREFHVPDLTCVAKT